MHQYGTLSQRDRETNAGFNRRNVDPPLCATLVCYLSMIEAGHTMKYARAAFHAKFSSPDRSVGMGRGGPLTSMQ